MPSLLPVGTILKRNATGQIYRVAEGSDPSRMYDLELISGDGPMMFVTPSEARFCYTVTKLEEAEGVEDTSPLTHHRLRDFISYARTSDAFEVSIYHLCLDPAECAEASKEFRRLADKIDAGLTKGGYRDTRPGQ